MEDSQIELVTIDLRPGYDFLVSILTRKPSIETATDLGSPHRAIGSYFQETLLWRLYIGFSCENSQLPLPITQPMPLAIHP